MVPVHKADIMSWLTVTKETSLHSKFLLVLLFGFQQFNIYYEKLPVIFFSWWKHSNVSCFHFGLVSSFESLKQNNNKKSNQKRTLKKPHKTHQLISFSFLPIVLLNKHLLLLTNEKCKAFWVLSPKENL